MLKNLDGPELLPFVKEVAHQCDIIRKQTGNNRQVNAIDQLTNKALQGKFYSTNGRPTVMTNTATTPLMKVTQRRKTRRSILLCKDVHRHTPRLDKNRDEPRLLV